MSPKLTRRLILSALFLSTAGICVSSAHAQFKINSDIVDRWQHLALVREVSRHIRSFVCESSYRFC
jgi:hypothetical protein